MRQQIIAVGLPVERHPPVSPPGMVIAPDRAEIRNFRSFTRPRGAGSRRSVPIDQPSFLRGASEQRTRSHSIARHPSIVTGCTAHTGMPASKFTCAAWSGFSSRLIITRSGWSAFIGLISDFLGLPTRGWTQRCPGGTCNTLSTGYSLPKAQVKEGFCKEGNTIRSVQAHLDRNVIPLHSVMLPAKASTNVVSAAAAYVIAVHQCQTAGVGGGKRCSQGRTYKRNNPAPAG